MGSKKMVKVSGNLACNPASTTAGSQKRRGRPPKDKAQTVGTGFVESPLMQIKSSENEISGKYLNIHVVFCYRFCICPTKRHFSGDSPL